MEESDTLRQEGGNSRAPEDTRVALFDADTEDTTDNKQTDESISSSESTSSSDEEDDLDNSYSRTIMRVTSDPVSCQIYNEMINKALSKGGVIDEANNDWGPDMLEYFALPADMWVDFMKDLNLLNDQKQNGQKFGPDVFVYLYERSLHDFQSLDLWRSYITFIVQNMMYPMDISEVRRLFQRAVTAYGMHPVEGGALWRAYFEFENSIVQQIKDRLNDDDFNESVYKAQIKRCTSVFKSQLKWPLLDTEESYNYFNTWLEENNFQLPESELEEIEEKVNVTRVKIETIVPFENALVACTPEEMPNMFKLYIEKLVAAKDYPNFIMILYERAVKADPKNVAMWHRYIRFIDREQKDLAFDICRRAVRCNPGSTELWLLLLLYSENFNLDDKYLHEKLLKDALKFSRHRPEHERAVRMANIEYVYRKMRRRAAEGKENYTAVTNAINEACHHLAENYGLRGDPQCVLLRLWARIEAIYIKNMEKARLLWTDILSQGHDRKSDMWLEYAALEQMYGDHKHLRRLFSRALNYRLDHPWRVEEAWLNFERDFGTWQNVLFAHQRIDDRRAAAQRERELAELAAKSKTASFKRPRPLKPLPNDKGKSAPSEQKSNKKLDPRAAKPGANATKEKQPPNSKNHSEQSKMTKGDTKSTTKDCKAMHPQNTVFLSNMSFNLTESDLRDIFSSVGNVIGTKVERDAKGHSRGYGYVEFDSEVSVNAALQKDREMVNGRPMFVSRYNPEKESREKGAPMYEMSAEKNKLFVKGLSFKTTEDDLKNYFSPYGNVKAVRVVLDYNGRSRGFAYVEFDDEKAASAAVKATNGDELEGHKITVAISDPGKGKGRGTKRQASEEAVNGSPLKKPYPQSSSLPSAKGAPTVDIESSLGAGKTHPSSGPRKRSHTQVTFVPRILQVASTSKAPDAPSEDKKKLGNDDFREMLLGSKK